MIENVPPGAKTEFIGVSGVLVAMQLRQEQRTSREHQCRVGNFCERRKTPRAAKKRQYHCHQTQRRDLANLDTRVETEQPRRQSFVRQADALQARGQAEPVDQAKRKHDAKQVRRLDAKASAKTVEVVEALVDDRNRNHRVYQEGIGFHAIERRSNQRDAVTERKCRNECDDVPEFREKEHDAEQEQQVVVTGQHMTGAGPEIVEKATGLELADLVGVNAMRMGAAESCTANSKREQRDLGRGADGRYGSARHGRLGLNWLKSVMVTGGLGHREAQYVFS